MSKRNKIIIAAVIGLLVLILIIFILWSIFGPKQPAAPVQDPSEINVPVVLPGSSAANVSGGSQVDDNGLAASLQSMASAFAERYGSYSSQGNFSNLQDLKSLMTLKMKAVTDNYIATQQAAAAEYYGITTVAVSSKVISANEESGQAEVVVSAQRQESRGSTINPRVFYQELVLQLAKTDDGWKIDSAAWQ